MRRPVSVRLTRLGGVFVFVFAIIAAQFSSVQFVSAATTVAWTGAAGDGKFSTAANWQGSAAPVNGDVVTFDVAALTVRTTVSNDITSLSLGGINFTGTSANYFSYVINGNPITLTGPIANPQLSNYNTITTDLILGSDVTVQSVIIDGGVNQTITTNGYSLGVSSSFCVRLPQLIGAGALNFSGTDTSSIGLSQANPNYSGAININSGTVYAGAGRLGTVTGGTTVSGSGILSLVTPSDSSLNEPLTLSGTGSIQAQHFTSSGCTGGPDASVYTLTLTGAVTMESDFMYSGSDNLAITGVYTPNGHNFTVKSGAGGLLTLPSGAVAAPVVANTASDSQPTTNLDIGYNQTTTLDGTRQYVNVSKGGTLMGTGTMLNLYADNGSIVAPGHSPGKMTVTERLYLGDGSTYQAQLQNALAGGYDQIQVSDPSRTTGGDIQINATAILNTSLYKGYAINKGDTFTIVNNLQPATQKITGTFSGLPEGTQFTVGNIVFSISYVGGDGNDVVLTALNTGTDPTPPNTGVAQIIMANPALVAGLGIVTAGILLVAARRRLTNKA